MVLRKKTVRVADLDPAIQQMERKMLLLCRWCDLCGPGVTFMGITMVTTMVISFISWDLPLSTIVTMVYYGYVWPTLGGTAAPSIAYQAVHKGPSKGMNLMPSFAAIRETFLQWLFVWREFHPPYFRTCHKPATPHSASIYWLYMSCNVCTHLYISIWLQTIYVVLPSNELYLLNFASPFYRRARW